MPGRSPKRKGALQQAKEYLRINPTATNAAVVEALSVSLRTVTAARAFLIQTGAIPRSYYDRTGARTLINPPDEDAPPGPILATQTARDLELAQDEVRHAVEEALTPEEQRKRLSAVARTAANQGNSQVEIAAIQALARLDAQMGARDRLGPGPPLTEEDKIHRLGLLLESQGKRIARKAWERAFGGQLGTETTSQDRQEDRELGGSAQEGLLATPADGDSARVLAETADGASESPGIDAGQAPIGD